MNTAQKIILAVAMLDLFLMSIRFGILIKEEKFSALLMAFFIGIITTVAPLLYVAFAEWA